MSEPITEDFVSFETARLLKDKGFNIYVPSFYDVLGEFNRKVAYGIGMLEITILHQLSK